MNACTKLKLPKMKKDPLNKKLSTADSIFPIRSPPYS